MNHIELLRHRDSLQAAIKRARDLGGDPELLGHWGRYLCILTAGFLENCVRILYGAHAQRRASAGVAAFVATQLERVQNPKASRFLEVARAFDRSWAVALEAYLDEDDGRRKNAIDSIMNNRHLIAHGRDTSISVARVREYFDAISEVIEYIETQCA